jgi:Ser/Thr protein kinase RdoA (MazF antagonist)
MFIQFTEIIENAWEAYDPSRVIKSISDISAKVSTNHVYKVVFTDKSFVIAKLSYFGQYEHFVEDHTIINVLANNLPAPYENFLSRSLIKGNTLYTYRFRNKLIDAWVVFYRPIKIDRKLPRRLDEEQIKVLGRQFAHLHQTCHRIRNTLPPSSKTLQTDIEHLLRLLDSDFGRYEHRMNEPVIREQCNRFLENSEKMGFDTWDRIPVFVDWNIGNFSVTRSYKLFSRWDYDWFRMSSRVLDFYFLSRIVSDVGDRTVFTYNIEPLMEERFMLFLKEYHQIYPLTEMEIRFLGEVYRFFILNYVIKDGRYFFHEIYATKLQAEAYQSYFPSLDKKFDPEPILRMLKL